MKQRIELFKFFFDKVPLEKVQYLSESELLVNFSENLTTSSMAQASSEEAGEQQTDNQRYNRRETMELKREEMSRYKDIFAKVREEKQSRRQSISNVLKRWVLTDF